MVEALGSPLASAPSASERALRQAERAVSETLEHHAHVRLRAAAACRSGSSVSGRYSRSVTRSWSDARRGVGGAHEPADRAAGDHRAPAAVVGRERLAHDLLGGDLAGDDGDAARLVAGDLLPLGRDRARVDREDADAGAAQLVCRASVKLITNAFVAAYTDSYGIGCMPAVEATLMTPPRPRSTMRGRKAWVRVTIASQLTPHLLGVALRVVLQERARGAEAGVVDEQLDLDSELGDPLRQRCRVGREVAGDDVGIGRGARRRGAPGARPGGRPAPRSCPRAASWRANCSPIPEEAPVTRAVSRIA